jgi:hypothetical protein
VPAGQVAHRAPVVRGPVPVVRDPALAALGQEPRRVAAPVVAAAAVTTAAAVAVAAA